jgi:glycosyltransferase involved in cell wall biosynthesis
MVKISAVIITYNEEQNIGRCIDYVRQVAHDIVVVDSFSEDRTKEICLKRKVRFFEREFTGYSDQKNFGICMAEYDHILSLDADEYLSETLTQSILNVRASWKHEAFQMKRLSSYGGIWVKHGNWYPDKQVRLWNRNFGRWGGGNPHERVLLQKGIKLIQLKGDLLHQSYSDSTATLKKIQLYSGIFASANTGKRKISVIGILLHASFAFFKSYILKRGFLDGFEGVVVAVAVANHTFYKYAKLYEANKGMITVTQVVEKRKVNRLVEESEVLL